MELLFQVAQVVVISSIGRLLDSLFVELVVGGLLTGLLPVDKSVWEEAFRVHVSFSRSDAFCLRSLEHFKVAARNEINRCWFCL